MLKLLKIEYKNFQAVGNQPITIDLNRSKTTLIGGKNGSGKSTLWAAIGYCLYGKLLSPDMKLDSVINSTNKKNLFVKIWFESNGDSYVVERGMKPGVFNIYKNDELLDKLSHSKDQQKILDIILGMDFNMFVQLIMLNKERFQPFMEMSAADRRKVIEKILDISIFSHMNEECKKIISDLKSKESSLSRERAILESKLTGQKRLLDEIQKSIDEERDNLQSSIDSTKLQIEELEKEIVELEETLKSVDYSELKKVRENKTAFQKLSGEFSAKVDSEKKKLSFFKTNDNCPTCKQGIDEALKNSQIESSEASINRINEASSQMEAEYEKILDRESELVSLQKLELELKTKIETLKRNKVSLLNTYNILIQPVTTSKQETYDEEATLYKEIEDAIQALRASENALLDEIYLNEQARNLLKDDAIKANIIKEYLSYINKKINEYLNAMDFYIGMTLDENFNESFKAMHKENFTYGNLSTGQKSRANLAIWLSLLEVASMKNSINCNFLALDEVLENLDQEGVQNFMKLCDKLLIDKNIFVVTQRFDEFSEYFRSTLKFKLNEGFTEIEKN